MRAKAKHPKVSKVSDAQRRRQNREVEKRRLKTNVVHNFALK